MDEKENKNNRKNYPRKEPINSPITNKVMEEVVTETVKKESMGGDFNIDDLASKVAKGILKAFQDLETEATTIKPTEEKINKEAISIDIKPTGEPIKEKKKGIFG